MKYRLDEEEDQYLVRSMNLREEGWYYCQGCEAKSTNWTAHHPNCPRGRVDYWKADFVASINFQQIQLAQDRGVQSQHR